jgi:Tfp pilus assembly protein FimT
MIVTALAAPGLMRGMAINRAQRATQDVARIGRRARSEAIAYGRAYALAYTNASNGRLQLWRGTTDTCRSTPWATVIQAAACATNGDCVDEAAALTYSTASHPIRIVVSGSDMFCFEPDGEMYARAAGLFRRAVGTQQRVVVTRADSGVGSAVIERRNVLFPFAAPARVER